MLQIYTDGQLTELPPDISLDLVIENPLFTTDRIPAPFSLSYDLPLSARNRGIFGSPERIALSENRFREHPTRILFAGLELANGVQTIESVSEKSITVNFSGSRLPENTRRKLWKVPMDVYDLTGYNSSVWGAQVELDGMMRRNADDPDAPFFAPPVFIKGVEELGRDPDNPEDLFLNTRRMYLNPMDNNQNYLHYTKEEGNRAYTLKIMPAFRVWYILEKILGEQLTGNIFRSGEWKKLCVQSLWHPDYNLNTNFPPWRASEDQREVEYDLARFMPDVKAGDFIVEMLKIPCASMFIRGEELTIETNADILRRKVVHDWSDQVIGEPVKGLEAGQIYAFGFSGNDPGEQPEGEIKQVQSVVDAVRHLSSRSYVTSAEVMTPRQVLQSDIEPFVYDYRLMQQDMEPQAETEEEEPDDERNTFDMSVQAKVVSCNVHKYWLNDDYMNANSPLRWYVPEIEPLGTTRPDTLLLGLWQGLQNDLRLYGQNHSLYPYLSATNYDAYGNRLGELSLFLNGEESLMQHHRDFAAWVEKDKLRLDVELLLTARDLHGLDLRDKFHIGGRRFFIKTLTASVRLERIEPSQAEMVEAEPQ